MKRQLFIILFIISISPSFSQVGSVDQLSSKYLNWFNLDYQTDGKLGTSVDKAYEYLMKEPRESKTVTVAVIDSGVDIEHEDLVGKIWTNENETPNNGIDDDQNGYIDDIHGWNFIGNSTGENIYYENLEYTRIVRVNDSNDPKLILAKNLFNTELAKRKKERENIAKFEKAYHKAKSIIESKTGISINSPDDLNAVSSSDQQVLDAKRFLSERYASGFTEEGLENLINSNNEYINYFLNVNYNARTLVGDNPNDITDKSYGNPDVKGPRSDHGTSVAGIIAAIRENDIGINGIASNVKIMCLRSTPRGDERDKDVALSIYYAVDNGADIINMSFGKQFSPQKKFVDEAVKYAEEKGVLIVHGSGNSGKNIDINESFPSDRFLDGSEPANWINVGASSPKLDLEVAAIFSNYGKGHVDIFAPGVDIISTDSSNTYSMHDGTSLSAPVVSGISALILSYYPQLEPKELIEILMASSFKFTKPKKVLIPTSSSEKRKKVKFTELSKSGGIANAYEALLEVERRIQLSNK